MGGVLVYNINFLTSLFYVKHTIPNQLFAKIKEQVNYIKNDPNRIYDNHNLAGALEEQLVITNEINFYPELETEFLDVCENIQKDNKHLNPNTYISDYSEVYIDGDMWINFQKKYEYNPPHWHNGDYAFVLFVNIPYNLDEEFEYKNSSRTSFTDKSNSLFCFSYTDTHTKHFIEYQSLYVDKSWEGTMLVFPSSLVHSVNPFYTSDDYRITISGNAVFER